MTAREVANRLGLSLVHTRRLYASLGAFKVGRLVRFDPDRVDTWIEERKAEAETRKATKR